MVKSRKHHLLPYIYTDQHIETAVAEGFRPAFRVTEVSKTSDFRGRDEKDFLPELQRTNSIFVTSDEEFVNYVLDHRIHHSGLVFIPSEITLDEKVFLAETIAGFIQGMFQGSASMRALHDQVLYPADEGIHSITAGKDQLEFSWDWLDEAMKTTKPKRIRR